MNTYDQRQKQIGSPSLVINRISLVSESTTQQIMDQNNSPVECYLPLGFRFIPNGGELISIYLLKRLNNDSAPYIRLIKDVNVYAHSPEVLTKMYTPLGEKAWYFFSTRNRKHHNGSRPNRLTKDDDGFWKATGGNDAVMHDREIVGSKQVLVYYQGKHGKAQKTNWIMHEYKAKKPEEVKFDELVLCRIYKREVKPSKNQQAEVVDNRADRLIEYPSQILSAETIRPMIDSNNNVAVMNGVEDSLAPVPVQYLPIGSGFELLMEQPMITCPMPYWELDTNCSNGAFPQEAPADYSNGRGSTEVPADYSNGAALNVQESAVDRPIVNTPPVLESTISITASPSNDVGNNVVQEYDDLIDFSNFPEIPDNLDDFIYRGDPENFEEFINDVDAIPEVPAKVNDLVDGGASPDDDEEYAMSLESILSSGDEPID